MARIYDEMECGKTYQFSSKSIGSELLFSKDNDYETIQIKKRMHVDLIADTYAWMLLPTEIRLILQIKKAETLLLEYERIKGRQCSEPLILKDFIIERFSNWLNSFAKTINYKYKRDGSLFIHNSCRKEITDQQTLIEETIIIHTLPETSGLVDNFRDWPHSSYHQYLYPEWINDSQASLLAKFGSVKQFQASHRKYIQSAQTLLA